MSVLFALYVEAEGCLCRSLRWGREGGVTLRGDVGVFLLEGVFMKWEKISVCCKRKSNRFALSRAYELV